MIPRIIKSPRSNCIIIISSLVLFFLLYIFLFMPRRIDYRDMYAPPEVKEEDGKIHFYYSLTTGTMKYGGGISKAVIYDYENGIRYYYHYVKIETTRWSQWFQKGKEVDPYFVIFPNGRETRLGQLDPDRTILTREQYEKDTYLLEPCYLRVYFVNSDGTKVILWEHPEMDEIIKKYEGSFPDDPALFEIGH